MIDRIRKKPHIYSHSAYKTMRLIEALASIESDGFVSLRRLSERVGQDKASVYRIINTLIEMDYVEKLGSRYKLGLRFLSITEKLVNRYNFIETARSLMQELALQVHERVFLTVLDRNEVVQIETIEGNPTLRIVSGVGTRFPLHAISSGKVFLAFMKEQQMQELLDSLVLKRCTEHTITDRQRLLAEVQKVREQGYAYQDEEYEPHIRTISAPIFAGNSEIVAALGIAGTTLTFTPEKVEQHLGRLVDTCAKISATLPK